MKHPQPDRAIIINNSFIAKTGANRKLKRLWGTTVVNGVEVLNGRRHYYGGTSISGQTTDTLASNEKLFRFLKVWNDVKDYESEGIKSAWFTLNKSNGPEDLSINASYISDNLNRMWWDTNDGPIPENLTLTTSIVISENFNNLSTLTGIDWAGTKEEIAAYIRLNYESIWSNKKIEQVGVGVINKGSVLDTVTNTYVPDEDDLSPDDPWLAVISRYALRTSGVPCVIKDVEVGLGNGNGNGNTTVYNTAVVTIEIPYLLFTTTTTMVQEILADSETGGASLKVEPGISTKHTRMTGLLSSNARITKSAIRQITYYETVEDLDDTTISRNYIQWEDATQASIYDNFWVQDGDIWYFKADVITSPTAYNTTNVKLNAYLFGLLDTGYKKKKVPWWKKLIAIVIFIVVAVISFYYPPAAVAANSIYAAAMGVIIGALLISVVSMVFSAFGANEWTMAFALVSKEIAPLVAVASIVMMFSGTGDISDKLVDIVTSMLVVETVDAVFGEGIGALFTAKGYLNIATKAIAAYSISQSNKLGAISDRNKDLQAEYDKLKEETATDSDVMIGYMHMYSKPATADWSIYASTYDLPYERGGGNMSMGNVQRTTKQATRKVNYDEPMFERMRLE